MAGSVDAIAHVQEGIIVDANQAWAELFGYEQPDALLGVPLMDLFEPASQAALKGALIACGKGQWKAESIKVLGARPAAASLPLDLHLEHTAVDGEPAVKLSVPRSRGSRRASPRSSWSKSCTRTPPPASSTAGGSSRC